MTSSEHDPRARAEHPAPDLSDRYQRPRLLLSEQMYGAGFQSSGAEQLLDRTSPQLALAPGERVLDLGCGTGGTLRYLARHYETRGTGVDGSADCVAIAREAAAAQAVEGLDFIHSDFCELELHGQYHALWTCQSLLYVADADKEACLRRVVPHLCPGRKAVLADFFRAEGPLSPAFVRYCSDCGFELPTIPEFGALIERAGLRVLDAVDYTDSFTRAMAEEVASLEANAAALSGRVASADIEHLRARWAQKIAFCRGGDLRAAYIVAQAPTSA